jgi:predicted Kef-type K+ transport protein
MTVFIAKTHKPRSLTPDVVGFLIAGAAISCLLFGFEMASQLGHAERGAALLLAGLAIGRSIFTMPSAAGSPCWIYGGL